MDVVIAVTICLVTAVVVSSVAVWLLTKDMEFNEPKKGEKGAGRATEEIIRITRR